jgi:hypothetical protein
VKIGSPVRITLFEGVLGPKLNTLPYTLFLVNLALLHLFGYRFFAKPKTRRGAFIGLDLPAPAPQEAAEKASVCEGTALGTPVCSQFPALGSPPLHIQLNMQHQELGKELEVQRAIWGRQGEKSKNMGLPGASPAKSPGFGLYFRRLAPKSPEYRASAVEFGGGRGEITAQRAKIRLGVSNGGRPT